MSEPSEQVSVEAPISEIQVSAQTIESVEVSELADQSQQMNTDQSVQEHHPEQDAETLIQEKEEVDPMLIKEQFKWAGAMVRTMKKRKDATIFLQPVDPVALGIPTYFTVITHPMDISTIEKKMASHQYKSVDGVFSDFELMFNNCYTFNGAESPIGLIGKSLHEWFKKELPKMPRSMKQIEAKKKKKSMSFGLDPVKVEPQPARRKSVGRKLSPEMKFCNHIHREVTKKQYAFTWPFMSPVDPDGMGIPHYRDIIKHPMDLSTIRKKLDLAEYNSPAEFESDFRLMLNNCFTFNPPGTDVYICGKQLEALFEMKWGEMTNFLAQYGERAGADSTDDDDDEQDQQHIQMLKTQLQLLNQQLQTLMERRNRRRKRRLVQSHPLTVSPTQPKPKKKKLMKKKEAEEMIPEEITYEQKRELSDNINILPPDKLPQVFEIIKENAQLNGEEEEEIELDIDSLDKAVLWKLYCFVKKHTRPAMEEVHTYGAEAARGESSSEEEEDDEGIAPTVPIPEKKNKPVAVEKKKNAWDIPFRTEKGDTAYGGSFSQKTASATLSKQPLTALEKTDKKQDKERRETKKRTYDSVLDSAWDQVSKKPEVNDGDVCSSPEYHPMPQLDLQGPSLEMDRFVKNNPDYEEANSDLKSALVGKMEHTVGELDWVLNDQAMNDTNVVTSI